MVYQHLVQYKIPAHTQCSISCARSVSAASLCSLQWVNRMLWWSTLEDGNTILHIATWPTHQLKDIRTLRNTWHHHTHTHMRAPHTHTCWSTSSWLINTHQLNLTASHLVPIVDYQQCYHDHCMNTAAMVTTAFRNYNKYHSFTDSVIYWSVAQYELTMRDTLQ